MSANYPILKTQPNTVAAHRECYFTFGGVDNQTMSITNTVGYALVILAVSFPITPEVGQKVYISGGIYEGFHVIRSVGSGIISLETAWIGNDGTARDIKLLKPPPMKLFKGWDAGELIINGVDMSTIQPKELIAEFEPEHDLNAQFRFDISGYLKGALPSPYRYQFNPDETDLNITIVILVVAFQIRTVDFTRVSLICEDNFEHDMYVYNSAYTQQEFNRYFVGTSVPMRPRIQAFTFTNGINLDDAIDPISRLIIRAQT